MITKNADGSLQFSMKLDESLLFTLPSVVMKLASTQLAAEIVQKVGEEIIKGIDPSNLRDDVTEAVAERLAMRFDITLKELERENQDV